MKVCQYVRSANIFPTINHLYAAKKTAKVVVAVVEVLITELTPKLILEDKKHG